jgi:hypothetical protein
MGLVLGDVAAAGAASGVMAGAALAAGALLSP